MKQLSRESLRPFVDAASQEIVTEGESVRTSLIELNINDDKGLLIA